MSSLVATVLQAAGALGVLMAAGVDFTTRVIPNRLALWVAGAGLASRVVMNGWGSWLSVAVAFAVFIPLGLLAGRQLIGGGDAKLITATTFLVEPASVLKLLLAIALAGGVLAGIFLAVSRFQRSQPVRLSEPPDDRDASSGLIGPEAAKIIASDQIPYGLAIFAGCAFILIQEAL